MSSNNIVQFRPYQLLGNMEHVIDRLIAHCLLHPKNCKQCGNELADDDIVLAYAKRLHELHKEVLDAMQKARLDEQLEHSVTLELAGRSPESLRREKP